MVADSEKKGVCKRSGERAQDSARRREKGKALSWKGRGDTRGLKVFLVKVQGKRLLDTVTSLQLMDRLYYERGDILRGAGPP